MKLDLRAHIESFAEATRGMPIGGVPPNLLDNFIQERKAYSLCLTSLPLDVSLITIRCESHSVWRVFMSYEQERFGRSSNELEDALEKFLKGGRFERSTKKTHNLDSHQVDRLKALKSDVGDFSFEFRFKPKTGKVHCLVWRYTNGYSVKWELSGDCFEEVLDEAILHSEAEYRFPNVVRIW